MKFIRLAVEIYRRVIHPSFWVCEWSTKTMVGIVEAQSGRFACFGGTRKEAESEAIADIRRQLIGTCVVALLVRKPSIAERLETLL